MKKVDKRGAVGVERTAHHERMVAIVHARAHDELAHRQAHGTFYSNLDSLFERREKTVNLHDHYVVVRGGLENGVVSALWRVDARGCLT